MELIVKPTDKCNFACTFCSSPELGGDLNFRLIYDFLKRYPDTQSIIFNGGDPLLVKPSKYMELIDYIEEKKLPTKLSFTTNLWDFYKHPQKWAGIFLHLRVDVCTSFNYGETRRISKDRVLTEDIFLDIMEAFRKRIHYYPPFISVINHDNKDKAIDNVRLAKKLDVVCKLNPALASGREGKPFPISDMYEIYLEVFKQNLTSHEYNTQQILKVLNNEPTICPISRSCDENIRVLQPNGYYTCGALADDQKYDIILDEELKGAHHTPLQKDPNIFALKEECFSCPSFQFCNGCRKNILDSKEHGLVEYNCSRMKEIIGEFINQSNIPM